MPQCVGVVLTRGFIIDETLRRRDVAFAVQLQPDKVQREMSVQGARLSV